MGENLLSLYLPMLFSEILGQDYLKDHLIRSVASGRIPHAQLFVGPEGSGALPLAIAYAREVLCNQGNTPESSQACHLKFQHWSHPDLHFVYPSVTTDEVKKRPKSGDFITDWREFLIKSPYGGLFDWLQMLDIRNKQGEIRVEDANEIVRLLSLKSYEGGYKVMIIFMAEKMNLPVANKLLKLLEEPLDKTLFLLVAENEEDIIPTILSRCQVMRLNRLPDQAIADALMSEKGLDAKTALKIAHQAQGNYNKANHLLSEDSDDLVFEKHFVDWVRGAFRAKGNAAAIQDLISWSEHIAALGRETQKRFLQFCIDMFRQALLLNYQATALVYTEPRIEKFRLENFAPFVNGNNIGEIFSSLSDAIYHIERNGNAKIILTDLSIKLTRLIHKK